MRPVLTRHDAHFSFVVVATASAYRVRVDAALAYHPLVYAHPGDGVAGKIQA
jgi:hypothetical protein